MINLSNASRKSKFSHRTRKRHSSAEELINQNSMPVSTSSTSWEYIDQQNAITLIYMLSKYILNIIAVVPSSAKSVLVHLHGRIAQLANMCMHAVHVLRNSTTISMDQAESGANDTERTTITFQEPTNRPIYTIIMSHGRANKSNTAGTSIVSSSKKSNKSRCY